jgi:hypothetical protein
MSLPKSLFVIALSLSFAFVACGSDSSGVPGTNTPGENGNDNTASENGNDNGNSVPSDGGPDSLDVDGSPYEGILCGEQTCGVDQVCCSEGTPGNRTFACIGTDDQCDGLSATCDDTGDCVEGSVCCGTLSGTACVEGTSCDQGLVLCAVDEQCPGYPEECCNPLYQTYSSCGACPN